VNKRILDGTGVWKSDKIARIQPEWIRAEYANWIPLALANGSFEADTRRIWATVYSYNRPGISFDDTEEIRREFCRVGLLFLWPDEASGKIWGYFIGIEKPGRLPAKSRLDNKHEPIGPTPPADALRYYIEVTRSKALDSVVVSQWLPRLWLWLWYWYWFWYWHWIRVACFARCSRTRAFGARCVRANRRHLERRARPTAVSQETHGNQTPQNQRTPPIRLGVFENIHSRRSKSSADAIPVRSRERWLARKLRLDD
jgi:hypothetical protein